jgi:tyrosine aminotransferase
LLPILYFFGSRLLPSSLEAPRKTDKELIPLSLGDPTVYGNFLPPEELTEAIVKAVRGRQANGYTHSAGSPGCRSAVRSGDFFLNCWDFLQCSSS